jgi:hypothetical protein
VARFSVMVCHFREVAIRHDTGDFGVDRLFQFFGRQLHVATARADHGGNQAALAAEQAAVEQPLRQAAIDPSMGWGRRTVAG